MPLLPPIQPFSTEKKKIHWIGDFFYVHSCHLMISDVDKLIVLSKSINALPYHFCCLCLHLCVYKVLIILEGGV